jgi:hypothetical protein
MENNPMQRSSRRVGKALAVVIARSEATKQSIFAAMDCFASLAMTAFAAIFC